MKKLNKQKGISLTTFIIVLVIGLIICGVGIYLIFVNIKTKDTSQEENNNNQTITTKNKEENKLNLASPKEIFSTSLPNSGDLARPSRIYKASNSEFTKNNSNEFNNYFSYEEGTGWTVKKEGLYSITSLINAASYNNSASGLISNITINGKEYEIVRSYYTENQQAVDSAQYVVYLNKNDKVDFTFTFNAACYYNYNLITVYAMFE